MATNSAIITKSQGEAELAPINIPAPRECHVLVEVKRVVVDIGPNLTKTVKKGISSPDLSTEAMHRTRAMTLSPGTCREAGHRHAHPRLHLLLRGCYAVPRRHHSLADTVSETRSPSNNPTLNGTPLSIYGGSTATGELAIQFASSDLTVVTTASFHNFDHVKSRGWGEAGLLAGVE
ncbi:hypothetical protein ACJZ2D_012021 [Fusarium nematophilum]